MQYQPIELLSHHQIVAGSSKLARSTITSNGVKHLSGKAIIDLSVVVSKIFFHHFVNFWMLVPCKPRAQMKRHLIFIKLLPLLHSN
jgi:hypothetical protein